MAKSVQVIRRIWRANSVLNLPYLANITRTRETALGTRKNPQAGRWPSHRGDLQPLFGAGAHLEPTRKLATAAEQLQDLLKKQGSTVVRGISASNKPQSLAVGGSQPFPLAQGCLQELRPPMGSLLAGLCLLGSPSFGHQLRHNGNTCLQSSYPSLAEQPS